MSADSSVADSAEPQTPATSEPPGDPQSGDGSRTAIAPPSGPTQPGEPGVPRPRRRTSSRNLVQAMGVTLGLVLFLVLIVPRPTAVPRPEVDLAGIAQGAASSLSFTPAVTVPPGWTVTSADLRRDTGNLETWRVNYVTDRGRYVGLLQAGGWNAGWQSSLTQGGTPQGTVEVNGVTWQVLEKPEKQVTSLVLRQTELTTLVLAKAGGVADAEVLAKSLSLTP